MPRSRVWVSSASVLRIKCLWKRAQHPGQHVRVFLSYQLHTEDDLGQPHGRPGLCEVLLRTLGSLATRGSWFGGAWRAKLPRPQGSEGGQGPGRAEWTLLPGTSCEVPQMTASAGQGVWATQNSSQLKDAVHGPESCGICLGKPGPTGSRATRHWWLFSEEQMSLPP